MAQLFSAKSIIDIKKYSDAKKVITDNYGDDERLCFSLSIAWYIANRVPTSLFKDANFNSFYSWQSTEHDIDLLRLGVDYNISDSPNEESYMVKPSQSLLDKIVQELNLESQKLIFSIQANVSLTFTRGRCHILDVFIVA